MYREDLGQSKMYFTGGVKVESQIYAVISL